MAFKFRLGDYLRDLITGFRGVVVARNDSITQCNQNGLQPGLDKDDKHQDARWFDEHSLEHDPARLGEHLDLRHDLGQPPG